MKKEMKVLHLLYQSLPNVQGSSIRSHQILKYQKKVGIDVFAITSPFQNSTNTEDKTEIFDGVEYIRSYLSGDYEFLKKRKDIWKRFNKIIPIIHFYRQASNIMKKENIDIIHGHSTFFCGIAGILLSKKFKRPFIYEVRGNWIKGMVERGAFQGNSWMGKLYNFLESFSIKSATEVVIIGQNLREHIRLVGRRNVQSCPVIYNSVDLDEIEGQSTIIPVRSISRGEKIVFGFIGSLCEYEGIDDLIRVFGRLKKNYSNCELMIVGSGEYVDELKVLANNKNIDVKFVGQVKREKVPYYYGKIDVIVLPRKNLETTNQVTPLKPLEAMGYRKAILGSDVGGIKEIINGENGLLYKAGSDEDLYEKLEMFLLEPQLIQLFGGKGYEWVKANRSWDIEIQKYKKLYQRVM